MKIKNFNNIDHFSIQDPDKHEYCRILICENNIFSILYPYLKYNIQPKIYYRLRNCDKFEKFVFINKLFYNNNRNMFDYINKWMLCDENQ